MPYRPRSKSIIHSKNKTNKNQTCPIIKNNTLVICTLKNKFFYTLVHTAKRYVHINIYTDFTYYMQSKRLYIFISLRQIREIVRQKEISRWGFRFLQTETCISYETVCTPSPPHTHTHIQRLSSCVIIINKRKTTLQQKGKERAFD